MNLKEIMSKRPTSLTSEVSIRALERWNPALAYTGEHGENTITILDFIGEDMWGEGVTSRRIAAALRDIGDSNPVTVLINSPGGDMFEGIAIYSLLKEHRGQVTVKVLGMAASAASVIAMAGDDIQISKPAFFMIHNAWFIAAGNRHDFREFADYLEPFDAAMSEVYTDRTGQSSEEINRMMDAESWINGTKAVELGFADSLTDSVKESDDVNAKSRSAANKLDVALATAGLPRSERRKLLADIKGGMPSATPNSTPRATTEELGVLPRLEFNF